MPPQPPSASPQHITQQRFDRALSESRDNGETLDFSRCDPKLEEVGELGVAELAAGHGNGKGVKRLALSHNSLTSLPTSFSALTRLRYLNLKGNDLREFPIVLTELTSLEILDVSKNKLRKMPLIPGRLISLRVLSISENRLKRLPEYFGDFTELRVLKIANNPMEWPPRDVMTRPESAEDVDGQEMKAWVTSIRTWIKQNLTTTAISLTSSASENQHQQTTFDDLQPPPSIGKLISRSASNESFSFGHSHSHSQSSSVASSSQPQQQRQQPLVSLASASSHTRSHSRSNSHSQKQLTLLSGKKSLPDLRQPHSQILSERQAPPRWGSASALNTPTSIISSSSRALPINGTGGSLSSSTSSSKTIQPPPPATPKSEQADQQPTSQLRPLVSQPSSQHNLHRKLSDDGLRRSIVGLNSMGLPLSSFRYPIDSSAHENKSANTSAAAVVPAGSSTYFRRLSTLPASTIPKTIPTDLLVLIDSARGLLFALSQIHSALRQHSLSAIDDRFSGVLARVLDPANEETDKLIDALDRFDSISRRATIPPPDVIRGVITACQNDVLQFGKVVAVLGLQLKVVSKTAGNSDVRFTRTLLLMLYGAMAEISNAWKGMVPLLDKVAPLLRDRPDSNNSTSNTINTNDSTTIQPSAVSVPRSNTPTKEIRKHSISIPSTRTPISPIPERAESHSPPSMSPQSVLSRSGSAALLGGQPTSPSPLGTPPVTTTAATPGPPSQGARSKSRRHAGSFSVQDVAIGGRIPPSYPAIGETMNSPIASPSVLHAPLPTPDMHQPLESNSSLTPSTPNGPPMVPLRSALRNPFAPSTSPLLSHSSPADPGYEISPFSNPNPFTSTAAEEEILVSVKVANGAGSLPPLPPPPPIISGNSNTIRDPSRSPNLNSFNPPLLSQSHGRHAGGGHHSAASSISSSSGLMSPVRQDASLGPSEPALAPKLVDLELIDMMDGATEAAFTVWQLIGDDLASAAQPPTTPLSPGANQANQPLPKRLLELLSLLPQAQSDTTRLRNALSTSSDIFEDATRFIQTVTQVGKKTQIASAEHQFGSGVKIGLGKLTKLTMECATLLHVSSLKRPATAAGGEINRSGASSSLGSARPDLYPQSVSASSSMRPLALRGRSRSATGSSAVSQTSMMNHSHMPRSAQHQQMFSFDRSDQGH